MSRLHRERAALERLQAGLSDPRFLIALRQQELDELIVQLNESLGTTMVVVTHELPSIFTIADRVIMLDAKTKSIIAEGDPKELRDHNSDERVRHFFNREPENRGAAGGQSGGR